MGTNLTHAALAALLLLATADRALAQKKDLETREVLREGSIAIASDDPDLSAERAKKILERVKAAYEFVKTECRWAEGEGKDRVLTVKVVAEQKLRERAHKTTTGLSIGPNTIVVGLAYPDEPRSSCTLAHEVTHIQDRRHLLPLVGKLPDWLTEGRAITMGRAFAAKLGTAMTTYDQNLAKSLARLTADEARRILVDDAWKPQSKIPNVFRMEAVGFLFLERLRLQYMDVHARLSKMIDAMGRDLGFEPAFEKQFGMTLAAARDAFIAHVAATEGDPKARLRGTALEGSEPPPKRPKPTEREGETLQPEREPD